MSLPVERIPGLSLAVGFALWAASASAGIAAASLDDVLEPVSPEVRKWATVIEIESGREAPEFRWHHYRDSAEAVDFWPASTIKVYAVVAALEYLNELEMPVDSVLSFEHYEDSEWKLDCARSMREMISEVFRRSSNEDYTLLLRFVGIDRMNTRFLTAEKGFSRSALMRGYVRGRPYEYVREEGQRIRIRSAIDEREATVTHEWSGVSYSKQRGATVISETTGNCTPTRDLAECLRRIFFHESLPARERFDLTPEQLGLLREGGGGWTGLRNDAADGVAWKGALEDAFPKAVFHHKSGQISTHVLDAVFLDDRENSGRCFIVVLAAESGSKEQVRTMAAAVGQWLKGRSCGLPEATPNEQRRLEIQNPKTLNHQPPRGGSI